MIEKKPVGRPKSVFCETTRVSLLVPEDVQVKLTRLARHKGRSLNDFCCQIFSDFVQKNERILKILDETDQRIAELEKAGETLAKD